MSSSNPRDQKEPVDEELEEDMLAAEDAAEEIVDDEDLAMDSDNEEILLQNDSIGYFDEPKDSLFTIAQHPKYPSIIAVGGSAGQEDDAPGAGWVFNTASAQSRPPLPASFSSDPAADALKSTQLPPLFSLDGHTDSINTLAWTLPQGEALVSGGLDGRLRAWKATISNDGAVKMDFLGEAQEVPEVNWIAPCPSSTNPNAIALGASDGSVWVYIVDPTDKANSLQIVQSYFLHTGACTAGAWTPDGLLLATISEDGSLYVWDVWGEATAKNLVGDNGMTAVALTAEDQRFEVEGGLYSLAIDPKGAFVAVGGATGAIKIVSLPRLASSGPQPQARARAGGKTTGQSTATAGGQILAALHTQSESIESLALVTTPNTPPSTLLAAGSVDGSIVVYDATRRFAVRRHISGAHEEHAIVKLEFIPNSWQLTSCGMDGAVRRWDLRGAGATNPNAPATAAEAGLQKEWKGHRGDGEGGGVLGFVQGETGERIVTAGDDGVALVFEA
ncbi:related to SQT1 Suppresses dominant-negative mutants of the ribosomal protein QSR1 [Fusarium fujikuroi]|nr:related to SQT1 Suppresses dominant-negative mutants of the ribosomal protein QSR1 [Fusarium fujikuroi]